ncbi:transcriptional regulator Myc-A-like isoform X2 [Papaver somniferum]|uniref:transcriptional regulator Myc-A-like isoform X2 n=1 Tax=Papaver somniferum TaxID=3469 RepID=UPI000E6FBDED|nr:transcriptional regulator Myc-A-like isoform X2 [Papaver somniferum]XP_026408939.1 transcriptional regulator Myc-A-like isoform X2 [Papaver somniferum]XP_026408940.1 transcriptional regulator Myc-A-like isoform X2 [Papaver somniferum]
MLVYLTWLMKIFGSWRRSTRRSGSLRACILGFRHLGGLTLNIFEASAFEGSVFTHLDAKPGAEERFRKIIEELEAEKKQLVKNLSYRNDKCSRLKNQLKIIVANFRNDAVLFRNQTIKMVCDDHNILHSAYPCLSDEVPKNAPNLVISDSEAGEYEDEESDEDEEEEKSDEDDEESIKK